MPREVPSGIPRMDGRRGSEVRWGRSERWTQGATRGLHSATRGPTAAHPGIDRYSAASPLAEDRAATPLARRIRGTPHGGSVTRSGRRWLLPEVLRSGVVLIDTACVGSAVLAGVGGYAHPNLLIALGSV